MKIKFIHIALLHLFIYVIFLYGMFEVSLDGIVIKSLEKIRSELFFLSKYHPLASILMGASLFIYLRILKFKTIQTITKSIFLHYLIVLVTIVAGILMLFPLQQFISKVSPWLPELIIYQPFNGYIELLYLLGFCISFFTIRKLVGGSLDETTLLDN